MTTKLDQFEALERNATVGPWVRGPWHPDDPLFIIVPANEREEPQRLYRDGYNGHDDKFVVAARNLAPALIRLANTVRRLFDAGSQPPAIDELRAALAPLLEEVKS